MAARLQHQITLRARILWRKIIRLEDTPRRIAMGFAVGLFVGMSPYFGLHSVTAAGISWLLRANAIASLAGVMISNPLTVPFIYATTYFVGRQFTGSAGEPLIHWSTLQFSDLISEAPELFFSLTIGGIVIGLPLAILGYWITHNSVSVYHKKRHLCLKTES